MRETIWLILFTPRCYLHRCIYRKQTHVRKLLEYPTYLALKWIHASFTSMCRDCLVSSKTAALCALRPPWIYLRTYTHTHTHTHFSSAPFTLQLLALTLQLPCSVNEIFICHGHASQLKQSVTTSFLPVTFKDLVVTAFTISNSAFTTLRINSDYFLKQPLTGWSL
jgi:hypothetical protein